VVKLLTALVQYPGPIEEEVEINSHRNGNRTFDYHIREAVAIICFITRIRIAFYLEFASLLLARTRNTLDKGLGKHWVFPLGCDSFQHGVGEDMGHPAAIASIVAERT
jgi:hypothetical protein